MAVRLFALKPECFPKLTGWATLSWRTCIYERVREAAKKQARVYAVDLRSDVLTKPTPAMRQAIMDATMDDDVFGEDATVNTLQQNVADMFNKESALFVPSGTMANLIAVLSHCNTRGLEVLLGHQSHQMIYEQGGLATLGGVHPRTMFNLPDGTFDLDHIESNIRPENDSHQPVTGLICVEDTHNVCGGVVLPLDFLTKLRKIADDHKLPVHMDGARLMNASAALDIEPKKIVESIDSVSLGFSKGLGAPVGSIIAGSGDFIRRAVRLRKALVGGMRQPGLLAAAAMVSLDDMIPRLKTDHNHTRMIAEAIMKAGHGLVHVDLNRVQTNIVLIEMLKGFSAQFFLNRLEEVTEQEEKDIGESISVGGHPSTHWVARLVVHSSVAAKDVEAAIKKITYVLEEMSHMDPEKTYVHNSRLM